MKVHILDDWFDTLRTLPCFDLLKEHDVTVWTDHEPDPERLATRVAEAIRTLIHPKGFGLAPRRLPAARPGDTLVIGAGTYTMENGLYLPSDVTVRGVACLISCPKRKSSKKLPGLVLVDVIGRVCLFGC